jgi:hypothetical protein
MYAIPLLGGAKMSRLPKIKLKLPPGYPDEEAFELEQARYRLSFDGGVFLVGDQKVKSYDELVHLATQDQYKNKEYIEVMPVLSIRCC